MHGVGAGGNAELAVPAVATPADLAATLDALYGLELGSLTGQHVGEAEAARPRFQQHYRNHDEDTLPVPRQAMETAEWRLSYAWDGVQHLHHRKDDPAEVTDVVDTVAPEVLVDLWELLEPEVLRFQETLLSHRTPVDAGP